MKQNKLSKFFKSILIFSLLMIPISCAEKKDAAPTPSSTSTPASTITPAATTTPVTTTTPSTVATTNTGGTITITVGTGLTPSYSWTGGNVYSLSVAKASAPTAVVWGVNTFPASGVATDGVASPVTHGTAPAVTIETAVTEKTLTSGVAYRISITRLDSAFGYAEFTPTAPAPVSTTTPASTSTPAVTNTPAATTTPASTSTSVTSTSITSSGGKIAITVGDGFHPTYSWTGANAKQVQVVRTSAPTVTIWGVELNPCTYCGGTPITSPITHGIVPSGKVGIFGGNETKLTSGVGYKVTITNSNDESGWAEFTAGGSNPPVVSAIGGAGVKVTQGDKSYTLQTGSTVNFKYLQAYDRELDPAGAKDTDMISGIYIRINGVKMAGVGITIKFTFPEKAVSEVRGKPLTEEDLLVSPWAGTGTFSYMNMWIDMESGMSDAGGKIFAINLNSAGVPFNGTITNNGVSGDKTNPLTEFAFDLP